MSSNELIAELLALGSGLESFNNFQILNIGQSNSLFAFAPQLVEFEQSCGGQLQQLLELSQSSIFNNLIESNLGLAGDLEPCLAQLLGLEQLFGSGQDNVQLVNNNDVNNSNNTAVNDLNNNVNNNLNVSSSSVNSTAVSNSTADANNKDNDKNKNGKDDKGKGKDAKDAKDNKKNGKRGNVVQRSGASKRQVLGGFGLGLMVVVGAFAL
jgi:hypothetical protein